MRALKWFNKKDIRVVDAEKPEPKDGEVLIKVGACGICGTDLHEYEAGPIFIPSEDPHPVSKEKAPVILGHEFAGEIVKVGKNVKNWEKGQRVTADACIVCGECEYCKNGLYNLCNSLGFNGLASDGGFAEYVTVPEYQLYELTDNISFKEGAVVEPLAVGIHAVKKSKFQMGESAAIIGAGTIGLASLQSLQAAGASKIFVIEISEKRKEFAKKLGATKVIDPTEENPLDIIKQLNNGMAVDVTIECVGVEDTVQQALEITRKGGRISVAGIFSKEVNGLNFNDIVIGEKEIIGSIGYKNDFSTAISLISNGTINAKELITSNIKLNDVVENGFEELIKNKDQHIKIMVSME